MSQTINGFYFNGGNSTSGEVGIEVELEGDNLPNTVSGTPKTVKTTSVPSLWKVENDGSLRGEAKEYVLKAPVARDLVPIALQQLDKALHNATLINSGRAGVHVHLNVLPLTQVQVLRVALLYLIFEQPLVKFCGESREGNLFCLRASDAEYLLFSLNRVIKHRNFNQLLQQRELRYSSLNFFSLNKFGSLEFRAMRSPVESAIIEKWINILIKLKDHALAFQGTSIDLLSDISSLGGEDFAYQVLGDLSRELDSSWSTEVKRGMRLVQPLLNGLSAWEKNVPMPKEEIKAKKSLGTNREGLTFRIDTTGGWGRPQAVQDLEAFTGHMRNNQPPEMIVRGADRTVEEVFGAVHPRAQGRTSIPQPIPAPPMPRSNTLIDAQVRMQLLGLRGQVYVSRMQLEESLPEILNRHGRFSYDYAVDVLRDRTHSWEYPQEWVTNPPAHPKARIADASQDRIGIWSRELEEFIATAVTVGPVESERLAWLRKSITYLNGTNNLCVLIRENRHEMENALAHDDLDNARLFRSRLHKLQEQYAALPY